MEQTCSRLVVRGFGPAKYLRKILLLEPTMPENLKIDIFSNTYLKPILDNANLPPNDMHQEMV